MLIYLAMIEGPEERSKFEQIYEKYRALMFYRARQILGDDRDAEDAVHEAFVRVANHIEKISDPECPKTRALVVIIVERISINEYNRKKRRGSLPLAEELLPGDLVQLSFADGAFTHCLVAEETGRRGDPGQILLAAHSQDVHLRPLSTYPYRQVRFLYILGIRRD